MPVRTFTQNEPLTDAELDRLGDFLKSCKGGQAMNVEALDGFFAALIAGPEIVMPSEYYSEVFGGEMSETCEFASLDEANEILGLMMRHWNTIAAALNKDEVYGLILLQDENGVAHGNDWAHGFMRGTLMGHDGWAELVEDEEHGTFGAGSRSHAQREAFCFRYIRYKNCSPPCSLACFSRISIKFARLRLIT